MATMDTAPFVGKPAEVPVKYMARDLILYAVGIGCDDLRYLYEDADNFAAFPTYPFVMEFKGNDQDVVSFPSPAMKAGPDMPKLPNTSGVLDGERYIEMINQLPASTTELKMSTSVKSINQRGSGALIETTSTLVGKDGTEYYKMRSGSFAMGAKNFTSAGEGTKGLIVKRINRPPDAVVEIPTSQNQAQLYRLSGDYNPLHINPEYAKELNFATPILHGLCTLGMTCNAVLKQFANGDAKRFKAMNIRFNSPVLPGETLYVEMWKQGDRIVFLTKIRKKQGRDQVALSNAYIDLQPEDTPTTTTLN